MECLLFLDVEGSFECDFGLPFFYDGKDDYCGYIDDSPGPTKWLRSQEYYTDRKFSSFFF